MFRKRALMIRPEEKILRRTSSARRKTNMGKMTDIIRRELLSESDEEDFEPPLQSTKKLRSSEALQTPAKRIPASKLTSLKMKRNMDEKLQSDSDDNEFPLSIDTDDESESFDLPSTLPSLPGFGHMSSDSILDSPGLESPDLNDVNGKSTQDSKYLQGLRADGDDQTELREESHSDNAREKNATEDSKKTRHKVLSKLRTQYYRQWYRTAWEKVPEFKGWLSSVEGRPSRAQCIYCDVELVAHSVSLMKHVSSAKHQRNAEKVYLMNSELYPPRSVKSSIKKGGIPMVTQQSKDPEIITTGSMAVNLLLPISCVTAAKATETSMRFAKANVAGDLLKPDNSPIPSKSCGKPTTCRPLILSTSSRPTILSKSTVHSKPQTLIGSQQITDQEDIDDLFDKVQIILDGDEVDKQDVAFNGLSEVRELKVAPKNPSIELANLNEKQLVNDKAIVTLNDEKYNIVTISEMGIVFKDAEEGLQSAELNGVNNGNPLRRSTDSIKGELHIGAFHAKERKTNTIEARQDAFDSTRPHMNVRSDKESHIDARSNRDDDAFNSKESNIVIVDEKGQLMNLQDDEQVITLHMDAVMSSDEEDERTVEVVKVQKDPAPNQSLPSSPIKTLQPISTHVIDSHLGLPISNLEITLYKLVNGSWRFVSELVTNGGGRATDFIPDDYKFTTGRFKLHYHVYKYWELKRLNSIFPFIEIPFDVRLPSMHLHFPLILSANGFNVYKGSAA